MKNKKIIITGGCGFIGSFLAERLHIDNEIYIIDNLSRGSLKNIEKLDCKFIEIDLCKKTIPKDILKNIDVVFHLASTVGSYKYYTDNSHDVLKVNTKIDWNVFESIEKSKVGKLFYASSSHVYPKELQLDINSAALKEEDAYPANPSLSYGWGKLTSERYLTNCKTKFKVAIARYNGIYGPRQSTDLNKGSIIPVLIKRAKEFPKLKYKILTQGLEKRAFCYIDDAIDATIKMVDKLEDSSFIGPLNIGRNDATTILSLAEKIKNLVNPAINIQIDRNPIKPEILCQYCDCSKALKQLGWQSKTTIEEGVKTILK